jgi:Protein of unknown function (DUF1326)
MAEWHFSGDYFENCNCSVVCPCLVSKAAPLTSRPTEGVCDVAFIIHVETGRHDGVALDGLNVAPRSPRAQAWRVDHGNKIIAERTGLRPRPERHCR